MFSRTDLQTLLDADLAPAVSIFVPTHVKGREVRQDPIRLRKLLGEAQEMLVRSGLRPPVADEILAPGRRLLAEPAFWAVRSEGLAVYLAPGFARWYRVPVAVEEEVRIDDRFHVRPLLSALTADGRFVVLAVAGTAVRLYEGTRFTLTDVPAARLPMAFPVLGTAEENTAGQTGAEALRQVPHIAAVVERYLGGTHVPLILAADGRLAGHLRRAIGYRGLCEEGVIQPPEALSVEALHAAAYRIVAPAFEQSREQAIARYRMLASDGAGRVARDVSEAVTAAVEGRVEKLLVSQRAECWGRYLPEASRTLVHLRRVDGDRELLDLAIGGVLSRDGEVYCMAPEAMPAETPVAAILRF
jgi:hypothetical protein